MQSGYEIIFFSHVLSLINSGFVWYSVVFPDLGFSRNFWCLWLICFCLFSSSVLLSIPTNSSRHTVSLPWTLDPSLLPCIWLNLTWVDPFFFSSFGSSKNYLEECYFSKPKVLRIDAINLIPIITPNKPRYSCMWLNKNGYSLSSLL